MPEQQQQRPLRRSIRSTAIPELKQVIVSFGGQVIMRDTFEEALADLLGVDAEPVARLDGTADALTPIVASGVALRSAAQMAAEAEAHYQRVRASLQEWDWAGAGEEMEALERTLTELRESLEGEE